MLIVAVVIATVSVQHSGDRLLSDVGRAEAQQAADVVATSVTTQAAAVKESLTKLTGDERLVSALRSGDPTACAAITSGGLNASGVALNANGDVICWAGEDVEQREEVLAWTREARDELPAAGMPPRIWFSPPGLPDVALAVTAANGVTLVHWTEAHSLLRSNTSKLGPRVLALAFDPEGTGEPSLAIKVGSNDPNDDVEGLTGVRVPDGRGVGPLGIDAYWASASTGPGGEQVFIGIEPSPYDAERAHLTDGLPKITIPLAALSLFGALAIIVWVSLAVRRLRRTLEHAKDGLLTEPVPERGPQSTRRIAAALSRIGTLQREEAHNERVARAEERERIVNVLDDFVADRLDSIAAELDGGSEFAELQGDLDEVVALLRSVVSQLHPTDLHRDGLRAAIAHQVDTMDGWTLVDGPDVRCEDVVEGFAHALIVGLLYRSPTGTVALATVDDTLEITVTSLNPDGVQWSSQILAPLGGTLTASEDGQTLHMALPTRFKELA